MDLPPERAKLLKGFPREKKWDTVCDHDLVHAKEPYTQTTPTTLHLKMLLLLLGYNMGISQ